MDFEKFCQLNDRPFNDRTATDKYIKVKENFIRCLSEEPLLMHRLWYYYESGERNKI